jgi:hypothetical protein
VLENCNHWERRAIFKRIKEAKERIWYCKCKEPMRDCEYTYNCNRCGGIINDRVSLHKF